METNKIYVAIGKEIEERESILKWVLKNFKGKIVFVIYVHVPAKRIPLPSGLELPIRLAKKNELEAFRAQERESVLRLLDDCSQMCAKFQQGKAVNIRKCLLPCLQLEPLLRQWANDDDHKVVNRSPSNVPCESTFVERDSITEGISELINQLRIENLVMGASLNNKYRGITGMRKLMSEKAENVLQSAPDFCHIWFICKDLLIYKREGVMQQNPNVEEIPSNSSKINNKSDSGILFSQVSATKLRNSELSISETSPTKIWRSSTFSDSQSSSARAHVPNAKLNYSLPVPSFTEEDVTEQHGVESFDVSQSFDQHLGSSSPSKENHINDNLYNNLEQAISEAESSWRDAFQKSVNCWNAEKQALEAIRKAKPAERLNCEELKLKKAIKEEEAENMKKNLSKVSLELSEALDQKLLLESEIERFNLKVKELEEKLVSEGKISQDYENDCKKLLIDRDGAAREAQQLRKQLDQSYSNSSDIIFSEFSYLELQKATNYFDPSRKIGEGSHGSMYKGFLHHTEVAVKLLVSKCSKASSYVQSQREFYEQVSCISKLRHPNLVTLMGACREPWVLVYEYLPGGPLIDRLIPHDDNSPSLPWQMRIRIAIDICSALIFLLSSSPTCTVQSDLTPVKLLLDANFTCKITDFSFVSNDTTKHKPGPYYVKPVNFGSDVYAFGIIVLQLLTGQKEVSRIVKKMKYALREGTLEKILDPLAGHWPFVQTNQLAHMALRCCDKKSSKRLDLGSDVWRVLSPMRSSCSSLSLLSVASHDQPPHYFICPILQEIMEDPHFATDGFTYEAEAIRGWFESGHDTSPMTNMKLTSRNLIPNRALRSVIQEWLHLRSTK